MAGPSKPFNPNPGHKKTLRPGLQVPRTDSPELQSFLEQMAEFIEQHEGNRGPPLNRFVTLQELKDASVITTVVKNRRGEIGVEGAEAGVEITKIVNAASLAQEAASFRNLSDTVIDNLKNGHGIVFDAALGAWRNGFVTTSGTTKINLLPGPWPGHRRARVYFDDALDAMVYMNAENRISVTLGRVDLLRIFNNSGATLGVGKAVYINGESTGELVENLPTVALARANALATSNVAGLCAHDIEDDTIGYVTAYGMVTGFGIVNPFDTTGIGNVGDELFLDADNAGALVTTAPTDPDDFKISIGFVMVDDATFGKIYVDRTNVTETVSQLFNSTTLRLTADTSGRVNIHSDTSTDSSPKALRLVHQG